MQNFNINNFEEVSYTITSPEPSEEDIQKIKNEYKKLPMKIFTNPWEFWMTILGSTSLVSFVSYLIIFTIIYLITKNNNLTNSIMYTLLFLLWIGPVILFTPLILLFAVGNTLSGNFSTPIGCGPRKKNGLYVDCI
jgi:hypothetical protein